MTCFSLSFFIFFSLSFSFASSSFVVRHHFMFYILPGLYYNRHQQYCHYHLFIIFTVVVALVHLAALHYVPPTPFLSSLSLSAGSNPSPSPTTLLLMRWRYSSGCCFWTCSFRCESVFGWEFYFFLFVTLSRYVCTHACVCLYCYYCIFVLLLHGRKSFRLE